MAAKHEPVTITFDSADDPGAVQEMFDDAWTTVFGKPMPPSVIDMKIEPEAVRHLFTDAEWLAMGGEVS